MKYLQVHTIKLSGAKLAGKIPRPGGGVREGKKPVANYPEWNKIQELRTRKNSERDGDRLDWVKQRVNT